MSKQQNQILLASLITTAVLIVINIILLAVIFQEEPTSTTTTSTTVPTTESVDTLGEENLELPTEETEPQPELPEAQSPEARYVTGEVTGKSSGSLQLQELEAGSVRVTLTSETSYTTTFPDILQSPSLDTIENGYFVTVECESTEGDCRAVSVQVTPVVDEE